jgi:4-amino-4-deoxy-L-arabinose transferase-like glycosyltransferase
MDEQARVETGESAAVAPEAGAGTAIAHGPGYPRWFAAFAAPRVALPVLAVFGLLLFIVNLGGYPLYTKGEPREAVTVYDIVHGGGVILPMRAGVEIPSKPLMMHWLAALASVAAGRVNEWTVRLPTGLLAIAGILICYLYVRRLFDDESAILSALILGTTFQYLQAGTGARVDMTLTFFMEAAFFEFIMIAEGLTSRRMLLYVCIACAVLTKGPIGLLLPGLVALVWIALERRWSVLGEMKLFRGAALVAVLAGGWYALATMVGGRAFVDKQMLAENFFRFFHDRAFHEGHAHPFYYMELALMAGFMPWTPAIPAAVLQFVRRPRPVTPRLKYLFVWFAAVLIFYNLPQSKRGVYLLALYPALAALTGIMLSGALSNRDAVARWIAVLSAAGGAIFAVVGAAGLAALTMLYLGAAPLHSLLGLADVTAAGFVPALRSAAFAYPAVSVIIPAALIAIGVYLVRSRPLAEKMVIGVAAGFACIALAVKIVAEPAIANTLSLKHFTAEAMKAVDGDSAGYLFVLNYDVAFYSGRDMPIVSAFGSNGPEYLIGWRHFYESMRPEDRKRFAVVLKSGPTELDGGDAMVLLKRVGALPGKSANPAHAPPRYSV